MTTQTNHGPLPIDAAKRIEHLERINAKLVEACRNLCTTGEALLQFMWDRIPDGQERKLEAAIKKAEAALAEAEGGA